MEIKKTTDYGIFKFRDDNRSKIDTNHVRKIADSIAARNLLEFREITVNEKMEIIDGQHRLEAAKMLKTPIYYKIVNGMNCDDIIILNVQKNWSVDDYMNYYVKQGNREYIKLQEFMKENQLSLKISLRLCGKAGTSNSKIFKKGVFIFNESEGVENVFICTNSIKIIRNINGWQVFHSTAKFWTAFIILLKQPNFILEKWIKNLEKLDCRVQNRPTMKEFLILLVDVYNHGNQNKIKLTGDIE